MNNSSSTGNSARKRQRVYGIPEKCWCGSVILEKISHTKANPFKRYYKCAYAFELRIENYSHCFKWVDEAHRDEIQSLEYKRSALKEEVKELQSVRVVLGDLDEEKFQLMKLKIKSEIFARVEEMKLNIETEPIASLKKFSIGVVVSGCLAMVTIGVLLKGDRV